MIKIILVSCLILLFTSQYLATRLPLELEQIYKFHKKVRKGLLNCKIPGQPPAKYLEKLKWSKLLARKAQKQADKCKYDSNDPNDFIIGEYETIGQNIAEYPTIERALKEWFDEHNNYNFEKNQCNGECKNYKQMVWNTTSEIGCGFKKCDKNYILVCNYAPGDSDGRPYEAKPRSACELPKL